MRNRSNEQEGMTRVMIILVLLGLLGALIMLLVNIFAPGSGA